MNKTILNVIRYFAWNMVVVGSLVLSTMFNFKLGITFLECFFGLEAVIYFLACFAKEEVLKKLAKESNIFMAYKIPFEMAFIALAFSLKHYYIGICMFVTFFSWVYLFAATAQYRGIKEESKTKEQGEKK